MLFVFSFSHLTCDDLFVCFFFRNRFIFTFNNKFGYTHAFKFLNLNQYAALFKYFHSLIYKTHFIILSLYWTTFCNHFIATLFESYLLLKNIIYKKKTWAE